MPRDESRLIADLRGALSALQSAIDAGDRQSVTEFLVLASECVTSAVSELVREGRHVH